MGSARRGARGVGFGGALDGRRAAESDAEISRLKGELKIVQKRLRAVEDRSSRDIAHLRSQLDAANSKVKATLAEQEMALRAKDKTHEEAVAQLRDRHYLEMTDMGDTLRAMPERFKEEAEVHYEAAAELEIREVEIRKKALQHVKEIEKTKEEEKKNMKEQYEFWLKKKKSEIANMNKEFAQKREAMETELNDVKAKLKATEEQNRVLQQTLTDAEMGAFPIVDRAGHRSIRLPRDRRGSTGTQRPSSTLGFRLGSSMGYSSMTGAPSPVPSVAAATRSRNGSTTSNTSAGAALSISTGLQALEKAEARIVELEDEVVNLRRELEQRESDLSILDQYSAKADEERRKKIEQEVLQSLSAHETVSYIHKLEHEVAMIREKLANEVRNSKELRVALDSKSRTIQKLEDKLRSGTNRPSSVMSSSMRSTIRPASASLHLSRPATAQSHRTMPFPAHLQV